MLRSDKPLRWGILGCGKISNDFCVALSFLSSGDHIIKHVSSQSMARSKEFASKFNVDSFSDEYIKAVQDANVDVCYVGTINTTHKELCMLAMNHGKHVLCEKPVALNSKELEEILQSAKENNVFFMEAVWSRCFPLYKSILTKLKEDYYGEPCVLLGSFGVKGLFNVERINSVALGGGVLIDIGIYLLTVADMIFQGHKIKDVKICADVDANGLDRSGSVTFLFEGNKSAHLVYNGDHELPNDVQVICSKGKIHVSAPFWCSESYSEEVNGAKQTFNFPHPTPPKEMVFVNSMGLRFEAEHVRECLIEGRKESPIIPHETSKRIMGLLDSLRDQLKNGS